MLRPWPPSTPSARPPPLRPVAAEPWCLAMLPEVSRTFALNIPLLPAPLDTTVTVAYLLCRIADTVEDEAAAPPANRADLLTTLGALVRLDSGWEPRAAAFARMAVRSLRRDAPAAEVALVRHTPTVLQALSEAPTWARPHVAACLDEMTAGLAVRAVDDGPGPRDLADLLAYCHTVAGTVGGMLTELFVDGCPAARPVAPALRARAEAFGRALQLVNILKDVRDDLDRGVCWLPRSLLAHHGLTPSTLPLPAHRGAAAALLDELGAFARARLDEAFAYALLLPPGEPGLRLFCLLPCLLAARTLALLRDAAALGPTPVKVDRATVAWLLDATYTHVGDDAALVALLRACAELPS